MTTPAGSGVTNKGTTYADGSQVTSTNLNDHVDDAVFNSNAVDDSTIGLNSSSPPALFVKDSGITLAKMADIAASTVIGNVTGSSATPTALTGANLATILNGNGFTPTEVNSTSTTAVDLPNGLEIRFGFFTESQTEGDVSFSPAFSNHCFGVLLTTNYTANVVSSAPDAYARLIDKDGFAFKSNKNSNTVFYLALGY